MRNCNSKIVPGLLLIALVAAPRPAAAAFENIFQGIRSVFTGSSALTDGEVANGLKEALRLGTGNAVAAVGQEGGYLNNPFIRIPLPGALQKSESFLRLAGYGPQLDAFSESMNRAAEKAAPQAREIFVQAIRDMTISDARQILGGGDTAATSYFKGKTQDRLREMFLPVVHESLAEVGATRHFQELDRSVKSLPFGGALAFDLDRYVTDGALHGLFHVLGEEERKIRQNPAARTSELLRKVFGSVD